LIYELNTINV